MSEISMLCKRTVVSSRAVQPGRFHTVSALDHIMENNIIRVIFYYRFAANEQVRQVKERMKESLSYTLSNFPMVTGRLQRSEEGEWKVKCNDAGIRVVEAEAKVSLEEWLQKVDRAAEMKLTHWEDMRELFYYWSTFYIKLTTFEGGGLAIGLSCTHLLVDAACATMLIKSWADRHLTNSMPSPPIVMPLNLNRNAFPRNTSLKPKVDLVNYYKSSLIENKLIAQQIQRSIPNGFTNYTTITFSFTDVMVKKCMMSAQSASIVNGPTPTPFEALAALFWVGVSKVKSKRDCLVEMSICLEMRRNLGLDKEFFGNAMVFGKVYGEDLREVGLANACVAICEEVKKLGNEEGLVDLIEWLKLNIYNFKEGSERPSHQSPGPYGNGLLCANWEGFSPYSSVFEKGFEPIRVSYYVDPVVGEGQILILPSSQEDFSRIVMVTLPVDQCVKLCEEPTILCFSPTILMGVRQIQV